MYPFPLPENTRKKASCVLAAQSLQILCYEFHPTEPTDVFTLYGCFDRKIVMHSCHLNISATLISCVCYHYLGPVCQCNTFYQILFHSGKQSLYWSKMLCLYVLFLYKVEITSYITNLALSYLRIPVISYVALGWNITDPSLGKLPILC